VLGGQHRQRLGRAGVDLVRGHVVAGGAAPPQHRARAVDDGRAQIADGGLLVAQARPVPVKARERLLDDVLGGGRIVDEQDREPHHPLAVVAVEVGQGAGRGGGRGTHVWPVVEHPQSSEGLLDGVVSHVAAHALTVVERGACPPMRDTRS
jgi:hypothetical protein